MLQYKKEKSKVGTYPFHFHFEADQRFRKTVYPIPGAIVLLSNERQRGGNQSSIKLHLSQMCSDHMDILCNIIKHNTIIR